MYVIICQQLSYITWPQSFISVARSPEHLAPSVVLEAPAGPLLLPNFLLVLPPEINQLLWVSWTQGKAPR